MFWGAGRYTVFDDEAFSCRRYVMPLGEMVSALGHGVEPDPPLYYILMNGWTRMFGVGPLGLRSMSIVLFLAALPVVRLAGEAWFDRRVGRLAMILCTLHPAHLFLGFAARWYSLMFLMVALLLWLTARGAKQGHGFRSVGSQEDGARRDSRTSDARRDSRTSEGSESVGLEAEQSSTGSLAGFPIIAAWALAAAGACYTNYFGSVVVVLAAIVGAAKSWRQRWGVLRWVIGGVFVAALYAPWFGTLMKQVGEFPAVEASWRAFASTGARTGLALLTGNLASVPAWWVWGPMVVFAVALLVLLVLRWRAGWPIAVVVLGCFGAGVATRTMIDKYIMTFSGAACLLAAALMVRGASPRIGIRGLGRLVHGLRAVVIGCLTLGWIGCGVNLITERYWSSLRWLDPFPSVVAEIAAEQADSPWDDVVVTSHPSARYYFAVWCAGRIHTPERSSEGNARPAEQRIVSRLGWRMAFEEQERSRRYPDWLTWAPHTPDAVLRFLPADGTAPAVPSITTVETAGFSVLPDWQSVQERLDRHYVLKSERTYLEDPEAGWKNRLDPNVKHPRWRIVVRRWESR